MEELTKKSKVLGIMYAGKDTFYAIEGPKKLCDELGEPVDGWGWVAVEVTPINLDMLSDPEISPVYDAPVFVVNGALVFNAKNAPFEIEHINAEFEWEGNDEPTEEEKEVITEMLKEYSLKSNNE